MEYSITLEVSSEGVQDEGVRGALRKAYQAFQPLDPYAESHLEYKERTRLLTS